MLTLMVCSALSSTLPFMGAVICYKWLNKDLKILSILFLAAVTSDLTTLYIRFFTSEFNVWIFHIYTLLEFIILTILLYRWQVNRLIKKVIGFYIPFYIIIWALSKYFIESLNQIDGFTSTLGSALLMSAVMITFYQIITHEEHISLRDCRFLVMLGILIYNGGNLFIFGVSNIIDVWPIHSIFNIISNIVYTFAFLCQHPKLNFSGLSS